MILSAELNKHNYVKHDNDQLSAYAKTTDALIRDLASHLLSEDFHFFFSVFAAPNKEKAYKAYIRKAKRVANALGMEIGDVSPRKLDGFVFADQYSIPLSKNQKYDRNSQF